MYCCCCEKLKDADHLQLLHHSEVRWFSKEPMLTVFELKKSSAHISSKAALHYAEHYSESNFVTPWNRRVKEKWFTMLSFLRETLEASPHNNKSSAISQYLTQLSQMFADYFPDNPQHGFWALSLWIMLQMTWLFPLWGRINFSTFKLTLLNFGSFSDRISNPILVGFQHYLLMWVRVFHCDCNRNQKTETNWKQLCMLRCISASHQSHHDCVNDVLHISRSKCLIDGKHSVLVVIVENAFLQHSIFFSHFGHVLFSSHVQWTTVEIFPDIFTSVFMIYWLGKNKIRKKVADKMRALSYKRFGTSHRALNSTFFTSS